MTLGELKEWLNTIPITLEDLTVKVEYPTEHGSSLTKIYTLDYDESDVILSYFKYEN